MRSFSRDLRFLRQLLRKTKHRYKDLLLVFPNLSFNFQPTTPSLEEDSSETVAHEIEIDLIITFKKNTSERDISRHFTSITDTFMAGKGMCLQIV